MGIGIAELSANDCEALEGMAARLLDLWMLPPDYRIALLGPANERLERIVHLLAIHAYLRMRYALTPELAYRWPTARNLDFNGLRPLDLMLDSGLDGIAEIRRYLEIINQE